MKHIKLFESFDKYPYWKERQFTSSNGIKMVKGSKLNWIVADSPDPYLIIASGGVRFHYHPTENKLLAIYGDHSMKFFVHNIVEAELFVLSWTKANGQDLNGTIHIDQKCEYCKNGYNQCQECDGNGYNNCPECDGVGSTLCNACGGEGGIICPDCDGESCENCDDGRIDCDECVGQGEINCPECDGNCEFTCDHCKDGKVPCQECSS